MRDPGGWAGDWNRLGCKPGVGAVRVTLLRGRSLAHGGLECPFEPGVGGSQSRPCSKEGPGPVPWVPCESPSRRPVQEVSAEAEKEATEEL